MVDWNLILLLQFFGSNQDRFKNFNMDYQYRDVGPGSYEVNQRPYFS